MGIIEMAFSYSKEEIKKDAESIAKTLAKYNAIDQLEVLSRALKTLRAKDGDKKDNSG
jgi:hypothetical protein